MERELTLAEKKVARPATYSRVAETSFNGPVAVSDDVAYARGLVGDETQSRVASIEQETTEARNNRFTYGSLGVALSAATGVLAYLSLNPEVVEKFNNYFFGKDFNYNTLAYAAVATGLTAIGSGIAAIRNHFKAKSLDNLAEETAWR